MQGASLAIAAMQLLFLYIRFKTDDFFALPFPRFMAE